MNSKNQQNVTDLLHSGFSPKILVGQNVRLSLHEGSAGGEGRKRAVLSGGSRRLAWLSLCCEAVGSLGS